jgi:hypothetical protein
MYLQEIFDQLSSGELVLSNLGEITEEKWPRAVMHINLGLSDLFKRFFLREGRLTLELKPDRTVYPLDNKYAVANTKSKIAAEDRFILDSADEKYTNDVLKVERIITATGFEPPMDDTAQKYPFLATDTAPFTLRLHADVVAQASDLPEDLVGETLEVVYRARHPKIDALAAGFNPDRYEVKLPDSHLQALCYYVAGRVMGPAGMGQTEGVTSTNYWQRYEAECASLRDTGVSLARNDGLDKLRDRGFV